MKKKICIGTEFYIFALELTKFLKQIAMSDITSRVKAIIADKLDVEENRSNS